MKIWLIDFDGKVENLALMRLSSYHKVLGDQVTLKYGEAQPELFEVPDKVYISCLFRWNRQAALDLASRWKCDVEVGGTGIDLKLRLPCAVEACGPDYSLYGRDRAIGFISRGCIRKCPWCVVPEKEGKIYRASSVQAVVGAYKEALLLDNNILALPDHCDDLRWLADSGVAIDFNQGLDARLVTDENAKLLKACRWSMRGPRLAMDSKASIPAVGNALDKLHKAGFAKSATRIYVLIGFEGLESDVERICTVYTYGAQIYVMGYRELECGTEPATEWDEKLYRKYRRALTNLPGLHPKTFRSFAIQVISQLPNGRDILKRCMETAAKYMGSSDVDLNQFIDLI